MKNYPKVREKLNEIAKELFGKSHQETMLKTLRTFCGIQMTYYYETTESKAVFKEYLKRNINQIKK